MRRRGRIIDSARKREVAELRAQLPKDVADAADSFVVAITQNNPTRETRMALYRLAIAAHAQLLRLAASVTAEPAAHIDHVRNLEGRE
jgi:hypothetical protein